MNRATHTDTAQDLISRSIREGIAVEVLIILPDDGATEERLYNALDEEVSRLRSEVGTKAAGTYDIGRTACFWGHDADGYPWRVHLVETGEA